MNVVIVESPSKAKSINKYLGDSFKVLASVGHVRDLSAKNDAIDTENDFQMKWETSDRGKKVIKEITDVAKKSENLYLATDPDREGEAIAWHVEKLLRDNSSLSKLNKVTVVPNITLPIGSIFPISITSASANFVSISVILPSQKLCCSRAA